MRTSVFYRLDSGNISVLQAGQWEHQCFTGWTEPTWGIPAKCESLGKTATIPRIRTFECIVIV